MGGWFSWLHTDSRHLGTLMQKAFAKGEVTGTGLQRSELESLQSLSVPGNCTCTYHPVKGQLVGRLESPK